MDPGQCHRRRRTKFTEEQLAILEKTFTHGSKFPSPGERMRLESKTGLSKEKISVWFQNRRAKEKREKGHDAGSKESTTTDSELETEDERQLSMFDETPEEDSEVEDTRNHQSNTTPEFKVTQPADLSTSDMKPPHPGNQSTGGFYQSEIEVTQKHQIMDNTISNIKRPMSENHPIRDIQRQKLATIDTTTPTNMKVLYTEVVVSTSSDIKHTSSAEKSDVDSKALYSQLYETRNNRLNAITVNQENIPHKQSNTSFNTQHRDNTTSSLTEEIIAMESCKGYPSQTNETRNEFNMSSDMEMQNLTNACSSTPSYVRQQHTQRIPQLKELVNHKETEDPRAHQHKQTSITSLCQEDQKSNTPNIEMELPHPKETNPVDSGDSYQVYTKDTQNHQDKITSDKVPNLDERSNMPGYIVLSLPGGTIAVKSTELCHREIGEHQQNTFGDIDLPHPRSTFTYTPTEANVHTTTEISSMSDPDNMIAQDEDGHYRSEFENERSHNKIERDIKQPFDETQWNTQQDSKQPHSTNISTNAPAEIKVAHPGGTVAVDLSGLYCSKNENTSHVPPVSMSSMEKSFFDEKQKNGVVNEREGNDEKPGVKERPTKVEIIADGTMIAGDSERIDDLDKILNTKAETEEERLTPYTATTMGNTAPECRTFGQM